MNVLIVDNEKINLEETRGQLPDSDEVIYCDNYQKTEKILLEQKIDVVAVRFYWLFLGDSYRRFQYSPVGLRVALDAYAVGVKTVIVKNNFMWDEEQNDPLNIFQPGDMTNCCGLFFQKAYAEKMILSVDQSRGYNDREQIHWQRCIMHAINAREHDNYECPRVFFPNA